MKRIIAALAMIVVFTSGCSSDNGEPKSPESSATPTPSATLDRASAEQNFLSQIRRQYPQVSGNEQEALDAGYRLCRNISDGATPRDFVEDSQKDNIDPGFYGYILGAAVRHLCPENSDFIRKFQEEYGQSGDPA